MLKSLRRKSGKRFFALVMSTALMAAAVVPARASLASVETQILEQRLLQHLHHDGNDTILTALETALAAGLPTVDQFVEAFLASLGEEDSQVARAVLSQVLPGMAVDPLLSGAWLVDLRRLYQADHIQSLRLSPRPLTSGTVARDARSECSTVAIPGDNGSGSNLTRSQIRSVVSIRALGP
ncbi:MAG: hypothetical protein R3178_00535 [Rhodothermales bacterium]|nr:hypothetical protein [Rhodothermales bacterium]